MPVTFTLDVFVRFADKPLRAAVGGVISGAVLRSGPPFYVRGHEEIRNSPPLSLLLADEEQVRRRRVIDLVSLRP